MTIEEFYNKYDSTPLEKRFIPLNFATSGLTTLHEIWMQVSALDGLIQPLRRKQDDLVKLAEPLLDTTYEEGNYDLCFKHKKVIEIARLASELSTTAAKTF